MSGPTYPDLRDCLNPVEEYGLHLLSVTSENDPELLTPGSVTRYLQDIRYFSDYCESNGLDPLEMDKKDTYRLSSQLNRDFTGKTARYRWDRISAMFDWWVKMGITNANPCEDWEQVEDLGLTISTNAEQQGKATEYACTQSDIRSMENHVKRHETRDTLLIRMLWQTGMRRGEISRLELSDLDRENREILVPSDKSKSDFDRVVTYQHSLEPLLREWLDFGKREEMAYSGHSHLFSGERGQRLGGQAVNMIVKKAAKAAGINERTTRGAMAANGDGPNRWKITAHSIRHGHATHLMSETEAGLWEISRRLGHSSVEVTEDIYISQSPRDGVEHGHRYGPE